MLYCSVQYKQEGKHNILLVIGKDLNGLDLYQVLYMANHTLLCTKYLCFMIRQSFQLILCYSDHICGWLSLHYSLPSFGATESETESQPRFRLKPELNQN